MNVHEPPSTSTAAPARYELLTRVLSGVVMAVAAITAVVGGGLFFSAFAAVTAVASLREWHRLINNYQPRHGVTPEMVATSLTVVIAVMLIYVQHKAGWPTLIVACGSVVAGILALMQKKPVAFHMAGAAYIGGPALALVAFRQDYAHGGWIVLGVFVVVWATDIGALLFGRLIGGPKLAPALSPAKTWAGFVGGTVMGGLASALYVAILGGPIVNALIFGVFLALIGHGGDLFESWVKRCFRAKNSGGLIPGHGGMLDRIDSLLFAAPVASGLVFLAHFDPLAGVPW